MTITAPPSEIVQSRRRSTARWLAPVLAITTCWLGLTQPASASARPDLVVASGTVAQTGYGSPTVTLTLRNRGAARARSSYVRVFLSGPASVRLGSLAVKRLPAGTGVRLRHTFAFPARIPAGRYVVRACADATRLVSESNESNNCRTLGHVFQVRPPQPSGQAAYTERIFGPPGDQYMVRVPPDYVPTHAMRLLVALHGCSGTTADQLLWATNADWKGYLVMAPIGRDFVDGQNDGCWQPDVDVPLVLGAIANAKQHFAIDPRRTVLFGYSSGGDLAYRTGFEHSRLFAGLLIENSTPFRDTGDPTGVRAAAARAPHRFHIVHLAHQLDTVYPIDTVQSELAEVIADHFPVSQLTRSGNHWDDDSPADAPTSGTVYDARTYLVPHMTDPWTAPGY
ncbi:MAG TPA: CARDB domain-containing protein [Nocardioides sp.]|nr:CARDB domain-containing protein [Nocardioides sp.]